MGYCLFVCLQGCAGGSLTLDCRPALGVLPHAAPQGVITEQLDQGIGKFVDIGWRHKQTCHTVYHEFRQAADVVATMGLPNTYAIISTPLVEDER